MDERVITVQMSSEHIDRNAKVNPKEAIKELIWNACDADATKIDVILSKNPHIQDTIDEVTVKDNGHGLKYEDIHDLLEFYGRSNKTITDRSPLGRMFHGKHGHGRYKSFSIGIFVKWESVYLADDENKYKFSIRFDSNNKIRCTYSEKTAVPFETATGLAVSISGIMENISILADIEKMRSEIISSFAAYLFAYPGIEIFYDSCKMNPNDFIFEKDEHVLETTPENMEKRKSKLSIISWKVGVSKEYCKLFICGQNGVAYNTLNISTKDNAISAYILGDIFDELHQNGTLAIGTANPYYESFVFQAKVKLREYINDKFLFDAVEEVKRIKDSDIYPYTDESLNVVDVAERQYFDLIAVEINNIVPDFRKSPDKAQKLTYRLIKEAVKANPDSLSMILAEVFKLSEEEQNRLASLLEHTTLPSIINMTQTISNRLLFIHALEQMVYNKDVGRPIRERTQFHKILLRELWIFGEKYALGASDVSLKNILKKYLAKLGRKELIPSIPLEAETNISKIPDLCLWNQYPIQDERIENLIIELKRPTKKLGKKEIEQIKNYAFAVSSDVNFPKDNTNWNFILLGCDFNDYVKKELEDRKDGNGNLYNSKDGTISISVYRWNKIILENKLRFNFLKDKLSYSLNDSEQALEYLHATYADLFEKKQEAKGR